MLHSHNRFPYSAITQRPDFSWPGGKRLAVYIALAVEHFSYNADGTGVGYSPGIPHPNTFNWAWREFGNRVGGWRLDALLRQFDMPASILVNTEAYEHCPELIAALAAGGNEVVAHGETNAVHPNGLTLDAQRQMILTSRDSIARFGGQAPLGWISPGANPTADTEDLAAEAGFGYTLDWPLDDQPVWMRTRSGPLLSVPYAHEINDIPVAVIHNGTAEDFARTAIDAFDEMLAQSVDQPLVFPITIHTFVTGQPFRLRHFRKVLEHLAAHRDQLWITTSGAIARHYAETVPPPST